MVTWAEALAVKTPGVGLLMVRVQVATLSTTLGEPQVSLWLPGAGLTLGVMVPKLTGLAPSGRALTVMVKVWAVPTSFTPLGAMEMLASTNFFTAGPLLPCVPSVARVTVTPPMVTWAEALAVKLPAELLLIGNVPGPVLIPTVCGSPV